MTGQPEREIIAPDPGYLDELRARLAAMTPEERIAAAMSYARARYAPGPQNALAHEVSCDWYRDVPWTG
jgi:hypothetical protein